MRGGHPVRRVGVIGDIHAEDGALEVALGELARARVDVTACVGDVVDGPGDAERCCALLRQSDVLVVRGNHDRWLLDGTMRSLPDATQQLSDDARGYLASLPVTRELDTVAGRVMLCHGIGDDDMAALTPDTRGYGLQALSNLRELMQRDDLCFVVGGHTHRRMVRPFPGLTVINAGTLLRDHEPCVTVLDFESSTVRFHELDGRLRVSPGEPLELPGPMDPSA